MIAIFTFHEHYCLLSTSRVSSAQRLQLKQAALSLPRCARPFLVSPLSRTCSMHAAISLTDVGSKYFSTPPDTSGKHEALATIAGTAQAMASTMGKQKPSYNDGITTRLAPLISIARSESFK